MTQPCVEIIITEAQTPHETENYWEKEEYQKLWDENHVEDVSSEELEQVRRKAEHIVARVINKANEIVQNGDSTHNRFLKDDEKDEELQILIEDDEGVEEEEEDEDEKIDDTDQLMKRDPQLVEIAKLFVCELLEKAVEEANRRREIMNGNSDDICLEETMETGSTPSTGTKRKPWYRRASTSVSQFFHRVCLCMRSKNNRRNKMISLKHGAK